MIAYASRTGTRRNLDALRGAGWRLLVSARGVLRHEGFVYAIDNGAWTAHIRGEAFDEAAFIRALEWAASQPSPPDWIILPDIVAGGADSLRYSLSWLARVRGPVLLAVQDGMEPADVAPHVGGRVGLAVGGSTRWKEDTMRQWGVVAQSAGCWLHVLRVNTARRIAMCADAGADSFDGSSASRFADTLPLLTDALRQPSLIGRCV